MWTLELAAMEWPELTALAERFGLLPCLFGSTLLRGEGADVDVFLVRRPERVGVPDVRGFLAAFGGEVVGGCRRADRATQSVKLRRGGRLWHFVLAKRREGEGDGA